MRGRHSAGSTSRGDVGASFARFDGDAFVGPAARRLPSAFSWAWRRLARAEAKRGRSRRATLGPATRRRRLRGGPAGLLDALDALLPASVVASLDAARRRVASLASRVARSDKHRRILTFLFINTSFMLVEFAVGVANDSIGLISDAFHMLFDNASVALAAYASLAAAAPPDDANHFGAARFDVIAGFVNALLLVFVSLLIVLESVERIMEPREMSTRHLLVVSVLGLVVNLVGLALCAEAHAHAHVGGGTRACCGGASRAGAATDDDTAREMILSPTCAHVAVSGPDGEIIVVDPESGAHLFVARGFPGPGRETAFSDDGSEVLSRPPGWPESAPEAAWDVRTGELLRGDPPSRMGFEPGTEATRGAPRTGSNESSTRVAADVNARAMFLHVLADALGSVGVIVSTLLVEWYGWTWADPLAATCAAALVLQSAAAPLAQAAEVLAQAVPSAAAPAAKRAVEDARAVSGVRTVLRANFWCLTPGKMVGTMTVVAAEGFDRDAVGDAARRAIAGAGVAVAVVEVRGETEEHHARF